MADDEKVVRVERTMAAPAEVIFEILADPSQHSVIDGSGSVKGPRGDAPARLALGTRFGMDMRIGLPYRMTNEVVEFEEGRLIGWRHVGGHVWRYRLEPADGGTRVTEEFDWSSNRAPLLLKVMNAVPRNREAMVKTLERLDAEAVRRASA
jgi:uncharacterized protein YndB with AHSA1/START domain